MIGVPHLLQPGVRPDRQHQRPWTPTSSSRSRRSTTRRRTTCARSARTLAHDFPERELLLPAGRHRQPGAQLRPVVADRRAGRVPRPARSRSRWRARCATSCARSPARPTCTSRRCSTIRRCTSTSIAQRAAQLGLTQRDVASSMLVSLSSSSLVSPSYFLNPQNNVNYIVVVKTPLRQITVGAEPHVDAADAAVGVGAAAGRRRSPSPSSAARGAGADAGATSRRCRPRCGPISSRTTRCSACSTSAPTSRGAISARSRATSRPKIKALGPLPQGHARSPCAARTRS